MDADELRRAHAAADAAYEPFPSFSAWVQEPVALGSWDDAAAHLASARSAAPVEVVNTALDEVLRAAAVDTGAIEGLYPTDRGFTMSVARNIISLDQAEVEAGSGFKGSFEAQLAGFQHAVRLATEDRPLTEADIRDLHVITCADQATYRVWTDHGAQERDLVKGRYKAEPNHVQLGDGTWHAYAPVDRVPDEMHRLVVEVGSTLFRSASAVVQAGYLHHAFTSVHPFPDGNGRVARLLGSLSLLRSASIPLWVEDSDKDAYLDALREADIGNRQPFLRFVTSTSLRLMRELALVLDASPLRAPASPPPPEFDAARLLTAGLTERLLDISLQQPEVDVAMPPHVKPFHPQGIESASGMSLSTRLRLDPGAERAILVGVDPNAEDWDRIVVLVYPSLGSDRAMAQHGFEVSELLPSLRPSALRRLDALAAGIVQGMWAEHERRHP